VLALLAVLPLAGCIASPPGSGGGQQQPLTVTVSPTPVSLAVGAQQTFTATVGPSGTSPAVTWGQPTLSSNSAASATGSGLGTMSANGVYTAPTSIAACPVGITQCNLQVVVTATSNANNSYSGQALVNVHVVVSLSPTTNSATGGPLRIGQGANLQFTPTVTGTTNSSVNWSAVCSTCASGQGGGGFDPNNLGLYLAPPFEQGVTTAQTVTLSATSAFDTNQFAQTTILVQPMDPLGTVTSSSVLGSCPGGGLANGTCYQVNISCDGIDDWSAYLKVNSPSGTPKGTVIFGTGSGGSTLYDNDPEFFYGANNDTNGGGAIVQGVMNAGYTTAQVSFGAPFDSSPGTANGWLQGPGGVRRLACRYATLAQWVYQNIHNSNTSAPLCATGNSGGSGAIGYAVFDYGLETIFTMVEPTSGPVMARIDLGCSSQGSNTYGGKTACNNPPPTNLDMSYSVGAQPGDGTAGIIDTAYQTFGDANPPTLCTDGVNGPLQPNSLRFQSDSIDYAPSKTPAIPISPTVVNVVFGGTDGSNAIGQGETFWKSVGPAASQACVQDAPHPIPAAPSGDGVTQIVTDIQNLCVLP
jgi:hypothetical protein